MSIFATPYEAYAAPPRRWIGGVCARLASACRIEPWIIRLAAVALLLWHPAWMIMLYLAMVVLIRNGGFRMPRRWPRARRYTRPVPASRGPETGLSALARRFAALDQRLGAIEAAINEPDYALKQKFRNL